MVEPGQSIAGAARGLVVWWSKPCTTGQGEAGRTAEGSGQQQGGKCWANGNQSTASRVGAGERDILGKRRRTSPKARNEVRIFSRSPADVVSAWVYRATDMKILGKLRR